MVSPAVTLLSPISGSTVNTPSVPVQVNVSDLHPVTATLTVNASPPQPITLSASSYSTSVTLENGSNTLIIDAVDAAGNRGTATSNILVDTEPPVVTITAPVAGVELTGIVSVTADVSDFLSGVDQAELLANGVSVAKRSTAPYNFR